MNVLLSDINDSLQVNPREDPLIKGKERAAPPSVGTIRPQGRVSGLGGCRKGGQVTANLVKLRNFPHLNNEGNYSTTQLANILNEKLFPDKQGGSQVDKPQGRQNKT